MLRLFWQARPSLVNNPVILRELIVRLRKGSSFYYLAIFLIVGFIASLSFWYQLTHNNYQGVNWNRQTRNMFLVLNMFQGLTVALLIPLISATIINIERERETWDWTKRLRRRNREAKVIETRRSPCFIA